MIGCGFMGLMLLQGLVRSCIHYLVAINVNRDRLALRAISAWRPCIIPTKRP